MSQDPTERGPAAPPPSSTNAQSAQTLHGPMPTQPLPLTNAVASSAQALQTVHGPLPGAQTQQQTASSQHTTPMAKPGQGLVAGQRLGGRYTITRRLAAGAMGTVYEAFHEGLRARVALKVMHAQLATEATLLARFRREAAVMAKLNHHRAVRVLDSGEDQGQLFLVMEFIEGRDVDKVLEQEKRLPLELVTRIALQLLDVLAVAHAQGIVHRDLKPANLLLMTQGEQPELKVADFGIAALKGASADLKATATGQFAGTPAYVSPEQCRGEAVDGRSDLYSAGCLLFELLTGRPPFTQTNVADLFSAHLFRPPPRLADVAPDLALPPALEGVLLQALAKKLEDRFPSAEAMAQAWQQAVSTPAKKGRADGPAVQRVAATQGTPVAVYAPDVPEAEREAVLQALYAQGFAPTVVDGTKALEAGAALVLTRDADGAVAAAKRLGSVSPDVKIVAVLPLAQPGALEAVLDAGIFTAVDVPPDPVELGRKLTRAAKQARK